jgi:hypothetical protein
MLDRSPKAFAEAGRQLSRQLVEHIERYAAIYGANRKCPVEDALQKRWEQYESTWCAQQT